MKTACAILLVACTGGAASAQSSSLLHFSPNGAYLTEPVRKALGQVRATDFSRGASAVGFSPKETRAIAAGFREGKLNLVHSAIIPDVNVGARVPVSRPKVETPFGAVSITSTQQVVLIQRTIEAAEYSWFFGRYATIHIAVTPAPPRDYKIVINGEACQPTEASTYEVPPGHAIVSVTRTGKPACAWAGPISSGQQKDVECRL